MSRLIVISNRVPTDDTPMGGLVFALDDALSRMGGTWIGAGEPQQGEITDARLTQISKSDDPYERFTFPLSEQEQQDYYLGFANSVLWPVFHRRSDLLLIEGGQLEAYMAVNGRVADLITEQIRPDDLIWVHDYHFLPLARLLRERGVTNRIGFFLHIPFPPASEVQALPCAEVLADWMSAFSLLGLQTQGDVAQALDLFRRDTASEMQVDGRVFRNSETTRVLSFPIGIDAEGFARQASEAPSLDLALGPKRKLIVGVDRMDYSKGLVHRAKGFRTYLEGYRTPDMRPTYVQVAPISRGDVPAYRDVREELEAVASDVNGAHSDLDWTPMRYIRRNLDRKKVAALFRRADLCMVTPLADGMNLVAKEFVAAQDPDDPGVLMLSQFAGAAEQMPDALVVNPYDTEAVAKGIHDALTMPLAERQERHTALAAGVFDKTIDWWSDTFLKMLRQTPTDEGVNRRSA